ncbi:hypothetical protein E2P81_ATG08825 [Venturia nashicola]|uniref:Uncharacterized protein n=1 Tax=Venturia nashicola TaxID=86259 RepID=A0A4Z1P698_9PEZI|nr:hypothetical protein E6O75_ATG09020 [Venturia nashicola]TLD23481.1 hypothetical protein E2P81_ATG08825 [Venturia nashicola]
MAIGEVFEVSGPNKGPHQVKDPIARTLEAAWQPTPYNLFPDVQSAFPDRASASTIRSVSGDEPSAKERIGRRRQTSVLCPSGPKSPPHPTTFNVLKSLVTYTSMSTVNHG